MAMHITSYIILLMAYIGTCYNLAIEKTNRFAQRQEAHERCGASILVCCKLAEIFPLPNMEYPDHAWGDDYLYDHA
jgi:hypothetical protein